jgi:hypothetical protein
MLNGVKLLVGLHCHRLLAELREPPLLYGDIFFDGATGGLILREPLFGHGHRLTRRLQPRVEGLLTQRFIGETALGVEGGGVEALQRDQAF